MEIRSDGYVEVFLDGVLFHLLIGKKQKPPLAGGAAFREVGSSGVDKLKAVKPKVEAPRLKDHRMPVPGVLGNLRVLTRSDISDLEKPSLKICGSFEKYEAEYVKYLAFRDRLFLQVERREAAVLKSKALAKESIPPGKPQGDTRGKQSEGVDEAKKIAKSAHRKALKLAKNKRRKLRKLQQTFKEVTIKTKVINAEVKKVAAEKKFESIQKSRSFASVVKGEIQTAPVAKPPSGVAPESSKKPPLPEVKKAVNVKKKR
jgi:hypothetical protein